MRERKKLYAKAHYPFKAPGQNITPRAKDVK
jgi:hypothetical protein